MSVFLSPVGGAGAQFFDNNGTPLAGGKLYTYLAGTTTPEASYTSSSGATTHSNPIVLDAAGRVPSSNEIWLTDNVTYKFVLKDANDVLIATWDNIPGMNDVVAADVPFTGFKGQVGTVESLAGDNGADWIGFQPAGTAATPRSAQDKMRDWVSVKDFGATGDGVTDDLFALQNAQTYVLSTGGGTLYFPPGTYYITAPFEIQTGINYVGASRNATVIKKTNTTTTSGGFDAVVFGESKTGFRIENFTFLGNRVRDVTTGVVTVSTNGLQLRNCAYYDVINTRAVATKYGYKLAPGNYTSSLQQATAQQAQYYGFVLGTDGYTGAGSTSMVLRNTTSWGCGGGWLLEGCLYTQLLGCACDESDSGKRPGDPFLPSGSGGDYQNPSYIFAIVGSQGVVIEGPGMENCWSKYLYCEGAQLTLNSPYIFNLNCNSTSTYEFIRLAGTGTSNVSINNPWGFNSVNNNLTPAFARRAFVVDDPAVQRINFVGRFRVNSSWGMANQYPMNGLYSQNETMPLDYTQSSMIVGESSTFFKTDPTDVSVVVLSGGVKYLNFDAVSADVVQFNQPLPSEGLFKIKLDGTYTSAYGVANIQIVETNGVTTNVLASYSNSGTSIAVAEWLYVDATTGYNVFMRITTNHKTDTMNFSNMQITVVPNQR